MSQMNAINFGLHQFLNALGDEDDANGSMFFVHKHDGDDLNKLEIPFEVYGSGFKIPRQEGQC